MKKKTFSRIAGAVAMMSIAAPLGLGIASAQTDPAGGEEITNEQIQSLVQENTTPSLTIHKYEGDPFLPIPQPMNLEPGYIYPYPNNGTDVSGDVDSELPGMEGVTFNVQRLEGLNPAQLADWKTYAGLDINDVVNDTLPKSVTLGEITEMTTGADGTVNQEFEQGFYLVTEQEVSGRTTGAPFLVSLPMTQPNNTEWNYDVHVFPKNQLISVNKDIADKYANTGDTVEYTITGDVPAPPADGSFSRYVMVDAPPEGMQLDDASVTVSMTGAEENVSLLPEDFTVESQDINNNLRVTLTDSGLGKLTTHRFVNPTAQVVFNIDATVGDTDYEGATGVERNVTFLYVDDVPGDPDNPDEDKDVTDDVEGRFTNVTLNKTGQDTEAPLAGAFFELYRCTEGANDTIAGPLTVEGHNKWTTDDNGEISITGLQVDNFFDGVEQTDEYDYCFVEVRSPEGYELLPDPVPFDASVVNDDITVAIENVPDNGGFELPRTGEAGIAGALVAGSVIAGAGAAYGLRRRKDNLV